MLLENPNDQTARTVVLLATYNGAKYIREFLDSLVAQTYTNFKSENIKQIMDENKLRTTNRK